MASWLDRLSQGLSKSRERIGESLNVLFEMGPNLDSAFWEELEESLILADMGAPAAARIIEELEDHSTRKALQGANAVREALIEQIAALFISDYEDPFERDPSLVLFVGINGAGKTTSVGKVAKEGVDAGRNVLIGSADTFRAAAIEQLDEWGRRADVEVIKRDRGSDPASVCYDVIERGEKIGSDLLLIDTAGRLHTSKDLMRELAKVVNVTRKRSQIPVSVVLVIDATTGQNGLQQAKEFNSELGLDAVILTKLDGTAKGGIAVAIAHELQLPIVRIGVGESIEDLRPFDPRDFARALIGQKEA